MMQHRTKSITLILFILMTLLAVTGTAQAAPPADGPLIPYTEDGALYGYKNMAGEWAIEPQFDSAGDFTDGLAPVSLNGQFGFIDPAGQFVIEPQFTFANPFVEGLALVNTAPLEAEKMNLVYIDPAGQQVIDVSEYEMVGDFSEGLAWVMTDNKFGFINPTGKIIIAPQFDFAYNFSEGLAAVELNSKFGFIDKTGQIVITPQFDFAHNFAEGLAAVSMNNRMGFVDSSGQMVIEPTLVFAHNFSEGLAFADTGDQIGFIDPTGALVITGDFTFADSFSEGLAPVEISGQYGYINTDGTIAIEPQFSYAMPFDNGLARVTLDNDLGLGFINTTGELLFTLPLPNFAGPVLQTNLVDYLPGVPSATQSGSCWTSSLVTDISSAYRCTVGNAISDPCLVADDGETLVCGVDPLGQTESFQLKLTEPLPEPELLPAPTKTNGPALTLEALQNAAYPSEWPAEGVAQLENGVYIEKYDETSASQLTIQLTDFVVFGDLDFDGDDDAVAVMYTNGGGSGGFLDLIAILNDNGEPRPAASQFLGDRANINAIAIDRGKITIDMITHGPNDPMCCPSLPVVLSFELLENELVPATSAWLFELANGAACSLATGATGAVDGKRVNYFCSDQSAIIGGLSAGPVWQAERVIFDDEADSPFAVKTQEMIDIRTVWQPVNPAQLTAEIGLTPTQVSLTMPVALTETVTAHIRPGTRYNPDEPPPFNGNPAHLHITFDPLPLPSWPGLDLSRPQMLIYPVQNYLDIYQYQFDNEIATRIESLQELIITPTTIITDELPVLPPLGAAQVIQAQIKPLDFNGGSGLRFITHYAQDVSPIVNQTVFYTFQGLTDDGQYYMALYYPVSASVLPDSYEEVSLPVDYEEFANNFDSYLQETTQALNDSAPNQFSPNLSSLDALVESLAIQ
jgi:hypothetical protein